jgi:atypical dual specificity phosphatase
MSYLTNTFSWVDETHLLAGSSCPGFNSSMEVDAEFLCQQNIKAVISLNDSVLDWLPLSSAGLKHIQFDVRDYKPPSLEQMINIIEFIELEVGKENALVVHCNAGMGRTGTVLAGLLMWRNKMTAADVIKLVRMKRRGSVQTYAQEEFLINKWEKYLLSQSS